MKVIIKFYDFKDIYTYDITYGTSVMLVKIKLERECSLDMNDIIIYDDNSRELNDDELLLKDEIVLWALYKKNKNKNKKYKIIYDRE